MTKYVMVPLHMVTELIAMLAVGSDDQIQEAALVAVRAAKPASTAQHDEEPVAWEFQHEETGLIDFVDPQQVEWGYEKHNPRWQKIGPVYRHPLIRQEHSDDVAVNRFAEAMKTKLAKKRDEGRKGWENCPGDMLSKMLIDHIAKGDPVDVANFCMMLHQNGQRIQVPPTPLVPTGLHATILDLCDTLENMSDMPLHKWALKSARLVSKIREGIAAFPTNGTPNSAGAGV